MPEGWRFLLFQLYIKVEVSESHQGWGGGVYGEAWGGVEGWERLCSQKDVIFDKTGCLANLYGMLRFQSREVGTEVLRWKHLVAEFLLLGHHQAFPFGRDEHLH